MSSGWPSEEGLITDGISVVDWALNVARIPPKRIVLVGQSLGTAVATAVAEHFATKREIDLAGLVLMASFTDMRSLLKTYHVGGILPVLSPLKFLPRVQNFFTEQIVERWPSAERLGRLIKASQSANVHLLHAQDDWDIVYTHSNNMFIAAANATSSAGMSKKQIDSVKFHEDLGELGWSNNWITESTSGGMKKIKQVILRYGGSSNVGYFHVC